MWKKEFTIETEVSKEQIWKIWSDVKNWNKWDKDVQSSELNGEFEKGTSGYLKPKKGPKSKFKIESLHYPFEFTTRSNLPFAKMDFTHRMEEKDEKTLITHGIEISGVTTFVFSKIIGKKIIDQLPSTMKNLISMTQNN